MILDFFSRSYFVIIYGIALIASIKTYRKFFDTVFRYLPIIIAYTFCNELLGYMIKYFPDYTFFNDLKDSQYNEIIYNLYDLVFFPYFYYAYWKLSSNKINRNRILWTSIIAMSSYIISCFFQNPMDITLFYAYTIASLTLLYCIFINFKEKYDAGAKIINRYNLVFWINSSLIIFYSTSPFLLIIGYTQYDLWEYYNLRLVLNILIVLMYSVLTIGFLSSSKRSFK